ncbi:hypothetical protein FVE85_5225 [Porphyridium purpureum]|uniref:5'-3' DNA helicase ZGRF1-like N-terminal domain-containing protein n=1 Tax=Porphyridium purpureum TaxID=35688 RepID=A0A5J4Z2Z2_PORPP|nr:hypothetical protein FVE85_5225 [Porphyridium purpureum]|eukprot:POR3666..scf295_1
MMGATDTDKNDVAAEEVYPPPSHANSQQRRFSVLYTAQKQKKRKTFHDGVLVETRQLGAARSRVVLQDDTGKQIEADVIIESVCPDSEFDMGQFLVQVEEELDGRTLPGDNQPSSRHDKQDFVSAKHTKSSSIEHVVAQDQVPPALAPRAAYRSVTNRKSAGEAAVTKESLNHNEQWSDIDLEFERAGQPRSLSQIIKLLNQDERPSR